jgi:hypothetical protein
MEKEGLADFKHGPESRTTIGSRMASMMLVVGEGRRGRVTLDSHHARQTSRGGVKPTWTLCTVRRGRDG